MIHYQSVHYLYQSRRFRRSYKLHDNNNESAKIEDPDHQPTSRNREVPSESVKTESDADDSAEFITSGITFPIQISSESIHESSQSNSHSTKLNKRYKRQSDSTQNPIERSQFAEEGVPARSSHRVRCREALISSDASRKCATNGKHMHSNPAANKSATSVGQAS